MAKNMSGESNRDKTGPFFSSNEHDEFARRMQALQTTIMNTTMTPENDPAAVDSSGALFMRDAQVIEELLESARARIDKSFRKRHLSIGLTILHLLRDGYGLARDVNGNVVAIGSDPLFAACLARLCALSGLSAIILLWKAVEFASAHFGAYEAHVKWTVASLSVVANRRALGGVFTAFRMFAAAPLSTLEHIVTTEADLQARLILDTTRKGSLRGTPNDSPLGTVFMFSLSATAIAEVVAFHLAGVGFRCGPCYLYFLCFASQSFTTLLDQMLPELYRLVPVLCRWAKARI